MTPATATAKTTAPAAAPAHIRRIVNDFVYDYDAVYAPHRRQRHQPCTVYDCDHDAGTVYAPFSAEAPSSAASERW